MTFVANAVVGLVWGSVWWFWYRDPPQRSSLDERGGSGTDRARHRRRKPRRTSRSPSSKSSRRANVLLAMFQYAASNITFFISITWLRPYMRRTLGKRVRPICRSFRCWCGAVALWLSGYLVTNLHRLGMPVLSRRIPAMIGYASVLLGLLLCTQTADPESVWPLILCFSLAIFGVEMTLSPSWAFCMDIGGSRSGAVSGAMNMVGNMGAAVSAVAFPYFVANVTIPYLRRETGTANSFFVFAAVMNVLAIVAWMFMNPLRQLKELSSGALRSDGCSSSSLYSSWSLSHSFTRSS